MRSVRIILSSAGKKVHVIPGSPDTAQKEKIMGLNLVGVIVIKFILCTYDKLLFKKSGASSVRNATTKDATFSRYLIPADNV